jgi:hypothetical protein
MKMGDKQAIDFYSLKLVAQIKATITNTPHCRQWVITAPPMLHIPSAANLIAQKTYHYLHSDILYKSRVSLVELKFQQSDMIAYTKPSQLPFVQYCASSTKQRIAQRKRTLEREHVDDIIRQAEQFADRGVIVVNDIKVTGTQQKFMQSSFEQTQFMQLHWLYIFEVDTPLGQSTPQIEQQINFSTLKSLDEFSELVCFAQIDFTAKCLVRLFALNDSQFTAILKVMSDQRVHQLLLITLAEGLEYIAYFASKIVILKQLCQPISNHSLSSLSRHNVPQAKSFNHV